MIARAGFAILAIGLTAAGVLAFRQARLQAAHEMTQARLRAALLDERLAELRASIAEETTPESLEAYRAELGRAAQEDAERREAAAAVEALALSGEGVGGDGGRP